MLRWSHKVSYLGAVIWVFTTLALAALSIQRAVSQDKGWLAGLFALIVGVGVVFSSFVLVDDVPDRHEGWRGWLRPKPLAGLFVATFAAFTTIMGVLGEFSPSAAVEDRPRQIQDTTGETLAVLKQRMPTAAERLKTARTRVAGLWGLPGCTTTFHVGVTGSALTIDGVRVPEPVHEAASIRQVEQAGEALTLYTDATGRSAIFTHTTNGVSQGLKWDDQQTPALDLVRC